MSAEERSLKNGETKTIRTTSTFDCGGRCPIRLHVRNGIITRVEGDDASEPEQLRACLRCRAYRQFVHHPERLTTPLVKRDGEFVETSWDEALGLVASKLANYSKDELAVISSAKSTNEDNYVAQKFTRMVLGTNNIDHCARL